MQSSEPLDQYLSQQDKNHQEQEKYSLPYRCNSCHRGFVEPRTRYRLGYNKDGIALEPVGEVCPHCQSELIERM